MSIHANKKAKLGFYHPSFLPEGTCLPTPWVVHFFLFSLSFYPLNMVYFRSMFKKTTSMVVFLFFSNVNSAQFFVLSYRFSVHACLVWSKFWKQFFCFQKQEKHFKIADDDLLHGKWELMI